MTLDTCQHGLFALEQEQLRSPYDLYRQWREMGPVVYLEDQDIYVVTRHDLIKSVNRQPVLFSNQNPKCYSASRGTMSRTGHPKARGWVCSF